MRWDVNPASFFLQEQILMFYCYTFVFDAVFFDGTNVLSGKINNIKPRFCTL